MDQDGTWHGGRPWSSPHCARWGHSSPPQKGALPPIFGSHLLWPNGGCIEMPLGTEVGLSPGDFVLDGDPAPYPKWGKELGLGRRLLWPNGCMDQDVTWYGGRPRPTRHCVRCGPSYPQKKGLTPTHFWPMPIVARWVDG